MKRLLLLFIVLFSVNAYAGELNTGGSAGAGAGATVADTAADTELLVGTGAGTAAWVPMSGNGSMANTGAFTLDVADVYAFSALGATASTVSFTAPIHASNNADPADAGIVRLGNAESICWEDSPAGTDMCVSVESTTNNWFDLGTAFQGIKGNQSSDAIYLIWGNSSFFISEEDDFTNKVLKLGTTGAGANQGLSVQSDAMLGWCDSATTAEGTVDTRLTRGAAGYTKAANAAGTAGGIYTFEVQSAYSKVLVDNTATAFVRIAVADDDYETVILNYTVYAEDAEGDARQVRVGEAKFAILNTSGTESCGTVVTEEAVNVTAGTLTVAFDCATGAADTIDLRATANTSLDAAAETLTIEYRVDVTSGTATVTAQ